MLPTEAALASSPGLVGPDDLVDEAVLPEELVAEQPGMGAAAPVQVQHHHPAVREEPPGVLQQPPEHGQIGIPVPVPVGEARVFRAELPLAPVLLPEGTAALEVVVRCLRRVNGIEASHRQQQDVRPAQEGPLLRILQEDAARLPHPLRKSAAAGVHPAEGTHRPGPGGHRHPDLLPPQQRQEGKEAAGQGPLLPAACPGAQEQPALRRLPEAVLLPVPVQGVLPREEEHAGLLPGQGAAAGSPAVRPAVPVQGGQVLQQRPAAQDAILALVHFAASLLPGFRHILFSESIRMVQGPSFTSSTSISVRKRPVSTRMPRSRQAATRAS